MVGIGLLVIAVGALAQAVLRENSSWPVVIPGLVLVGIGAGLAMASLTSTAMSAVPWQQAGMAGGALSAFRQLGYALGIAVLGEVFDSGLTHGAGPGLSAALSGGQAQAVLARTPALAPVVHRAFADGLDLAYLVAGGFGLLATVLVFTLVRQRPQAGAAGAAGRVAGGRARAGVGRGVSGFIRTGAGSSGRPVPRLAVRTRPWPCGAGPAGRPSAAGRRRGRQFRRRQEECTVPGGGTNPFWMNCFRRGHQERVRGDRARRRAPWLQRLRDRDRREVGAVP